MESFYLDHHMVRKLCIYWTKYTDNGLFTFVWLCFSLDLCKHVNCGRIWLEQFLYTVLACFWLHYKLFHAARTNMYLYATSNDSVFVTVDEKGEDKDGTCHGNNEAIPICEWTMSLLISLDIGIYVKILQYNIYILYILLLRSVGPFYRYKF